MASMMHHRGGSVLLPLLLALLVLSSNHHHRGAADALSLPAAARSALAPLLEGAAAALERAAAGARGAAATLDEPAKQQQQHDDGGARAADAAFASITGGNAGGGAAASAATAAAAAAAAKGGAPVIRTLSWQPRAWLWHNFLTAEEADHLIALGAGSLARSDVVDTDTGAIVTSRARTSSGAFLPRRGLDPIVASLEERIARWVQVPVGNGEPFHVLRYNPGEEYTAHFDYLFTAQHTANGGQRVATVILYLSDVPEGGETVFPDSPTRPSAAEAAGFSECARKGLGVKARRGDALLFFSLKPDGATQDTASLHAGCPVARGTKWVATKWIRVGHHVDWGDPEDAASAAAAAVKAASQDAGGESEEGEGEVEEGDFEGEEEGAEEEEEQQQDGGGGGGAKEEL